MDDIDPQPAAFSSIWLRLLAESTQDYAIFAVSSEGIVLTWNPGGERIQGYRPNEIVGQPYSVFFSEADCAAGAPEAALRAAGKY